MPPLSEHDAVVLVHVLNPYGMAWLRRFNENNVDLNRNFRDAGDYVPNPLLCWDTVNALLNPPTPPDKDGFYLRAAWLVLRHGMPSLRIRFCSALWRARCRIHSRPPHETAVGDWARLRRRSHKGPHSRLPELPCYASSAYAAAQRGTASAAYARWNERHLTKRSSQPLAVAMPSFTFMRTLLMFAKARCHQR